MVKVRPFETSMLPEIYRALLRSHAPQASEHDWHRVFDRGTAADSEPPGYVLFDRDEVVGILGTLFSERTIDGVPRRFCNLHTWVVDETHRGHALLLMRPVLRLRDHTVTDFTPTRTVYEISKKLGFADLDDRMRVLLPAGPSRVSSEGLEITSDATRIEQIDPSTATISRDHAGCGQLLIADAAGRCHVVYTTVRKPLLHYCYLHYLSDPAVFRRHDPAARRALLAASDTSFVVVDARLVAGLGLGAGFDFPLKTRKLYRSRHLRPEQIDNLYSEQILMNLSGFTNVSLGMTRALRRWSRRVRFSMGSPSGSG